MEFINKYLSIVGPYGWKNLSMDVASPKHERHLTADGLVYHIVKDIRET